MNTIEIGTKVIVPTGENGTVKSIENGIATIKYRYTRPGRQHYITGKYEFRTIEIPVADVVLKNPPKPRAKRMTADQKREMMFKLYMYVFDSFAATTREIADEFGLSLGTAYRLMQSLDCLVCGEVTLESEGGSSTGVNITARSNPGSSINWQCWQTYDHLTTDEAIALFNEKFPK